MDTREQLLKNVLAIVEQIETPRAVLSDDPSIIMEDNVAPCGDCYTYDEEEEVWRDMNGDEVWTDPQSAFDFIGEALDMEYTISGRRKYLGARICVTFGGPNIYVDTRHNTVTGYWGSDTISRSYEDNMGLDEAARELFGCED